MNIEDALNLHISENFGCGYEEEISDAMQNLLNQLDSNVSTCWGASQFVIINPKWDKVIKIPFDGMYEYDDDANEEYFYNFKYDYCERSFLIYEKAIAAGVADIFAKIEYLGFTKEYKDIYVQERIKEVYCDSNYSSHEPSKDTIKKVENIRSNTDINNYWKYFTVDWLAAAIEAYGLSFVKNFIEFCNKEKLTDLHTENYGWREDGTPVLIDWAGFDY